MKTHIVVAVISAALVVSAAIQGPPADASIGVAATSSGAPTSSDFASGSDVAIDGAGDADGYHVRLAAGADGFTWRDLAILRPADLDPSSWYGYQCLSTDGKYAAVAVLPGDAINDNTERDHGAFAYSINVVTGDVKALGSGVGLKYHSPQCGIDHTAVFTSNPGSNESTTVATRYDLSSGTTVQQAFAKGQVTSVVGTGNALIGAQGTALVQLPGGGDVNKPVAVKKVVEAGSPAYDLRDASDGGVDFLAESGGGKVSIRHESGGKVTDLGTGSADSTRLFPGTGGKNFATAAKDVHGDVTAVDTSVLPLGANNMSLNGTAAFGADRSTPSESAAPSTQAQLATAAGMPLVESTKDKKIFQSTLGTEGATSSRAHGPTLPGSTAKKAPPVQPAPTEATRSAFTGVGPTGPAVQTASLERSIVPATSPGATTPTCSVARLQPNLQAMQPSNAQVNWATQMAEQGLLTGSAYTRPANYANMGLVAYAPSSDFPPVALNHPASDTWTTVPRSVMLAIEAQESNFNQASWHALPGIAADPLIANYYGSGDAIDRISYPNSDCGYGVAQVTSGMAVGDTSISVHGQMKVAVDYEENISAGLNILQKTWNQLYQAGITANGGDPKYLENWYFAVWAYNTGIQPTAAFGNTSGCTPGPTCTGPDGTWGLGWSNNPRNPDYDPTRSPYLKNTYADAAHPSSWPYQERILGWMGSPIVRYGFTGYYPPTYHGGNTWLQVPAFNSFCTSDNHCDPANAAGGYCSLGDAECWWHQPVTWVSICSTTCATSAYEVGAGSTQPTYTDPYPPTCNQDTSKVPAGSIIVDDLATPAQNLQGCAGMNWSNGGSFTYSPGTNSSGDPVGNIDTHQLGAGFGGHILFTHAEPAGSTSLINTGTWTPNLPSLQYYTVKIHIPSSGARATDVVYTINPGGSASPWKIRVNQDWESEQWVTIGTFAMQNGGNVKLTNTSSMTPQGFDVAYDAIAFVPKGGTPGQPIGGPPGIQDAPKGSNPAWVNCGCVRRTAGDPVDTATGYFGETITDLTTPGLGEALNLSRTYSSSLADPAGPAGTGAVDGAFGHGWTFNYGMTAITGTGGVVTIKQEDGSAVPFTVDGSGNYTATAPRYDATLVKSGSTYLFTRHATDQFTFDVATGRLTTISDPAGRAATPQYATVLGYDTSGNLHTVTDPGGRAYTFTWTGSHISKISTAGGQEIDYFYNVGGNLADIYGVGTVRTGGTNGDQDHTQYGYNTLNLMTSQRTPVNYGKTSTPTPVTSMTYDTSERVLTQTDPLGKVTTFTYGPNSDAGLTAGQNLVTDPVGNKILYVYQGGLLTSMTKGYGASGASTWSYAYDPISLGISIQTNPDGSTNTFAYDDSGHQISASDGLGRTTSTLYDAAGRIIQKTDPSGTQTTTAYNAAGAPTTVTISLAGQSAESANNTLNPSVARAGSFGYADAAHPGEATTSTNPNGHPTTYAYDAYGDLTSSTDAASHVTRYGYDTSRGLKTSTVTPTGTAAGVAVTCTPLAKGCTTYTYDAYGNVITTTDPLGHTVKATFDADGNQLTATDGNNHTTTTTYDNADRPTTVTKPSTDATSTTYNDDGTIKKTTDADSHDTSYLYDAQGRATSMTDPDNKTTSYIYDSMSRLKTTTKPNGDVATQTWDNAGQLSGISYSGTATHAVTYSYDLDGRRTSMGDATGTTTYAYDAFGETTGITTGAGNHTGYGYDAVGNVTSISYPGGATTVARHFNTIEQLDSITDPGGGTTSFGYNPDGAPTTTGYANGTTATVAVNDADQPTSSTLVKGTTALGTLTYTRDNTGDLSGITPTSGAPGIATTYNYNSNQYLTESSVSGTTTGYSYDSVGDPTKFAATNQVFDPAGRLCWTTTSTVTAPTCGSPASGATTYGFDDNGARTSKTPSGSAATIYGYNAAGEMTSVSGATTATYTYDGDGLRASKTIGSTTNSFTWNTVTKVPQLLSDGITDYVYGPTGAAVEQFGGGGANPAFYFADAHGSTTEITNAAGAVSGSYAYTAWGAVSSHSGVSTPIEFGSAYTDIETGLIYLQARYYDPSTGTFTSVDALVWGTLAPYLYVGNDPLNRFDPLGLDWNFGVIAGLISSAAGIAGLALDVTGVGAPFGAILEGVSLGAGLAATIYDCSTGDSVSCALDGVGLATAGIGGIARVTKAVFKVGETAKYSLKAVDGAGGAFGLSFGVTGNIAGVGKQPEKEKQCGDGH